MILLAFAPEFNQVKKKVKQIAYNYKLNHKIYRTL